ncbi:MAG: hypothetical protein U9Q82_06265 [Chloroflexota bacterium]|nr:hypothetical protein [Chloroflexota bacterium]
MSKNDKTTINVEGGIHAGRDVIQGDQINYGDIQITNASTPDEFTQKLAEIQSAIQTLKQQPDLSSAQTRNIEAAEEQVSKAAGEVQNPETDGKDVQKTLTEAKETFDLLSSGIASAAGLGVVLGNMAKLAIQIFGG